MWHKMDNNYLFLLNLLIILLVSSTLASECGVRSVKINEAIVRGQPTSPGDWPWHVAIHHLDYSSDNYACGGTLISEIFVLTADHCIRDNNGQVISSRRIFVRLGLHNLRDLDRKTFQQHNVHKTYRYRSTDMLKNDIAILELSTEAEFTDFVQPACLNQVKDLTGQFGTAVGWGADKTDEVSPILISQQMPVVSTNQCLERNEAFRAVLDSSIFCAGYTNGTTVCNGDSGGGLHFERNGVWYVGGIVSFTAPRDASNIICHLKSYAGFTNVHHFLPWINQVTGLGAENENEHVPKSLPSMRNVTDPGVVNKKAVNKSNDADVKPKSDPWYWVPASNGALPANAAVGGYDGGNLYIARAWHKGEVMPGKLFPPRKCCFISWGGAEHIKKDYEVLCNANGKFVKTSGSSIPDNAIIGGYSIINNEPLYIGRVSIDRTLTLGKVSRLHGVCYIPYAGKEFSFSEYEVYVSQ